MEKNIEIDRYIAAAPEKQRVALTKLRESIFEIMPPGSEEVIYYHMPTYKYQGKPILVFSTRQDYSSLITMRKEIIKKLAKELEGFDISGTTIHFSESNMVTKKILRSIVKERLLAMRSTNT